MQREVKQMNQAKKMPEGPGEKATFVLEVGLS